MKSSGKSSGSSVSGGRRGSHVMDEMSLGEAKKLRGGKSKPNLNSKLPKSSKVTNKPSMSGKRMK